MKIKPIINILFGVGVTFGVIAYAFKETQKKDQYACSNTVGEYFYEYAHFFKFVPSKAKMFHVTCFINYYWINSKQVKEYLKDRSTNYNGFSDIAINDEQDANAAKKIFIKFFSVSNTIPVGWKKKTVKPKQVIRIVVCKTEGRMKAAQIKFIDYVKEPLWIYEEDK